MKDNVKEAYDILLEKILRGEFTAGQKLREEMLVSMLDMSRTPIRTALAELSRDGVVKIIPQRYTMVVKFDEKYITQVGIVRVGLDLMSAKLALYYGSNADFDRLNEFCDMQEKAVSDGDNNKRREIDCMFHREITNISKNEILIEMQKSLYLKVRHILTYNDIDRSDKYASVKMHRKIAAALIDRDEEKTIQYIKEHLFNYYKFKSTDDIFKNI